MLHFRPMPVFSLCAAGLFLILLQLGVWQLRRAEWKTDLLQQAQFEANLPDLTSLDIAMCTEAGRPFPAELIAWPLEAEMDESVRVYGRDRQGRPGWRIFLSVEAPTCLNGKGGVMLAEWAFQPDRAGTKPVRIEDLRRVAWPDRHGFAPDNALSKNEWYWFDAEAIADKIGSDLITHIIVFDAGHRLALTRTPAARHYGYAVTWFGLALALIGVYIVFHKRAGRL